MDRPAVQPRRLTADRRPQFVREWIVNDADESCVVRLRVGRASPRAAFQAEQRLARTLAPTGCGLQRNGNCRVWDAGGEIDRAVDWIYDPAEFGVGIA